MLAHELERAEAAEERVAALRNDRDRYEAVLEWLEKNYPAALELCPFKAPTRAALSPGGEAEATPLERQEQT